MSERPPARTLGELRASGWTSRGVREELRANLVARLRRGDPVFPGVHGYEDTVVPAVVHAVLAGHDLIFLGERGQAKTRMIRGLVGLLDPWLPVVAGSEIADDPTAPVSAEARRRVAEHGDATPIEWVARDARYGEKLATPDTSIADLIGDIDPVKVAEGRRLSDEETIHFGLLPRTHRGVFCINELPDLTEKVQVGLFNILEERDFQVRGHRVRLPIDVLVVASANPEDYTSRGRIITPLKDRYAAQVRTHYPPTREIELRIVRQEAGLPTVDGVEIAYPAFMEDIVGEITFQARNSPDVNQVSGVSVRMTLAGYETLAASAVRRALQTGEGRAVPRVSDLCALRTAITGKLELEYAGADRDENQVTDDLVKRAVRRVFEERVPGEGLASVVEAFNHGWTLEVSDAMPAAEVLTGIDEIPGLREGAAALAGEDTPEALAAAVEFILEGLHLQNQLNKTVREGRARYAP